MRANIREVSVTDDNRRRVNIMINDFLTMLNMYKMRNSKKTKNRTRSKLKVFLRHI